MPAVRLDPAAVPVPASGGPGGPAAPVGPVPPEGGFAAVLGAADRSTSDAPPSPTSASAPGPGPGPTEPAVPPPPTAPSLPTASAPSPPLTAPTLPIAPVSSPPQAVPEPPLAAAPATPAATPPDWPPAGLFALFPDAPATTTVPPAVPAPLLATARTARLSAEAFPSPLPAAATPLASPPTAATPLPSPLAAVAMAANATPAVATATGLAMAAAILPGTIPGIRPDPVEGGPLAAPVEDTTLPWTTPAAGGLPRLDLAAAFPAPLPLHDRRFAEALGSRLQWMAEQGGGEVRLRLAPEGLGPIEIRLQLDGDRVDLAMHAVAAETRQALEQALPRLRELLAQGGLQLGQADVGQGQGQDAGAAGRESERATLAHFGRVATGESGEPAPAGPAAGAPPRRGEGLLDLYA